MSIPLSFLLASTMAVGGIQLHRRAAQSKAVCTQEFAWMGNSKNISPCQVVASLDAICNNGNWVIDALNASVKYDLPSVSARTASFCTCSWASYNLISACTACQGFPEQISAWSPYSVGCAGLFSNSYFPANVTLPDDVSIPSWAGEDPTTWPGETFNVAEAKQIASQGKPDLTKATTPKKSKNIGAIAGGVISGILVICTAIGIAFWMLRRQRQLTQPKAASLTRPDHMRSISDITTGSNVKSVSYATLTTSPMPTTNPPTSPTILTHSSSIRSIPFMSSMAGSTVPYGTAPTPPPGRQTPTVPASSNREDFIVPFTLPPTSSNLDRKQANGAPVYDPPNAPPPNALRMDIMRPVTPTQRARFNPPPYEASSADGSSSGRPHHRGKQASTDTDYSLTSTRGNGGAANMTGVVSPGPPSAMRPAQRSNSRDQNSQPQPTPTEASFSARDVA